MISDTVKPVYNLHMYTYVDETLIVSTTDMFWRVQYICLEFSRYPTSAKGVFNLLGNIYLIWCILFTWYDVFFFTYFPNNFLQVKVVQTLQTI